VFVPVDIVRGLAESGRPLAPGVDQRFMSVMFTDIAGFTGIAEQLTPQQLSEQTLRYFGIVTSAIAEEGGTVDKFIGDSVMTLWGAPRELQDHVFRACVAALRIDRRMRMQNAEWKAQGRRPMPVRLGLHCADVVVGNVGAAERLSYTVMGDGVNIAARLEGLNKEYGTSVCISEAVNEQVRDRTISRPIQRVAVRGRAAEFIVYELQGIVGTEDPELIAQRSDEPRARADTDLP
jgi:adenylate cyclase